MSIASLPLRDPLTPVEQDRRSRSLRRWAVAGSLVFVAFLAVFWGVLVEVPEDHADPARHFLYGSIGSDSYSGIPHRLWAALPEMFPEYLPEPERFRNAKEDRVQAGYGQFGFLFQDGMDRPVGFSRRRVIVDRVGLNCAVCHVGTVRVADGLKPERIYGREPAYAGEGRVLIPGMPAITVDLQGYAAFLHRCASDSRFTKDNVLAAIDARGKLGPLARLAHGQAVPLVREALLRQKAAFGFMAQVPAWGPGRVDTFNPYKTQILGSPWDGSVGTSDLPSLWNQRPREGMQLHWDGNNTSVRERNLSASLGAGATPVSVDLPRLFRVAAWIGAPDPRRPSSPEEISKARNDPHPREGELPVPRWPFALDKSRAARGAATFARLCASCHGWKGEHIGKVDPLERIGTDPERLRSYTDALAGQQNTIGAGQWWRFSHFRRTAGYANQPLDGLWARSPYLHNGSVPTLADLLKPGKDRPSSFFRGDDRYDKLKVGFRTDRERGDDGRKLFKLDTSLRGNGNRGHEGAAYGTTLPEADKQDLLEYLKTL